MELLPVDLDRFWKDDELAHKNNCFDPDAPQVALGLKMSEECVLAEFGEEIDNPMWIPATRERRIELNKRYNDKAEKIVGKRLLSETFPTPDQKFPDIKRIGEVFGGKYVITGGSEWLESDITTYRQLEQRLDEIDKLDLRDFILPPEWEAECKKLYEQHGIKPGPIHIVRGPVTLACSIIGVQNLILLLYDEPDLGKRFSDTMTDVIIKTAEIMDEEAGAEKFGFVFCDDNCCMLNDELYEFFGYPVLDKVFKRFSPQPHHTRYQHSDSAMEHLLPILGKLDLNGVNFGPTVTVEKIRPHLPNARIDGCISPMTFMQNDIDKIIAEAKRDCEAAKIHGKGVNLTTAGSINYGSSLEGMRAVMHTICEYGRY